MTHIPVSLGLVVAVSVTFARALWTQERNFLVGERTRARVHCRESPLNATAVGRRRRASHSQSVTSRSLLLLPLMALAGIILLATTLPPAFAQSNAYEGPVGVTGIFNGNITTGCSYDPLNHSAKRTVTDIFVPGSVGKYPLKMTRYYNSRSQDGWLGPGWFHEYGWLLTAGGDKLISPQGNVYEYRCENPVGVSEGWEGGFPPDGQNNTTLGTGTFRLADGGEVHFDNFRLSYINDPYGLTTTITRDALIRIWKVIEPGGRYLQFIYDSSGMLTTVEAHDGQGNTTDSVNYSYTSVSSGGIHFGPSNMLTRVDYSDGTLLPIITWATIPQTIRDLRCTPLGCTPSWTPAMTFVTTARCGKLPTNMWAGVRTALSAGREMRTSVLFPQLFRTWL